MFSGEIFFFYQNYVKRNGVNVGSVLYSSSGFMCDRWTRDTKCRECTEKCRWNWFGMMSKATITKNWKAPTSMNHKQPVDNRMCNVVARILINENDNIHNHYSDDIKWTPSHTDTYHSKSKHTHTRRKHETVKKQK